MPAITSKKIVLRDQRFFLETTVIDSVDLGSQEFHLQSLMRPTPVFTPNFASIGERFCHLMSSPSGPGINQSWLVFTKLDKLPFRSAFVESSGLGFTAYYPCTRAKPESTAEKCFKDQDFPVPAAWGKCWFLTSFAPFGRDGGARPTACYLFLTRGNEVFLMAYPNIHSNGRVCMGRDWDANPAGGQPTIALQFMHCLNTFFSTEMNSDLTTNDTYRQFSRSSLAPNGWEYRQTPTVVVSNAVLSPLSGMNPNFAAL